MGAGATPAGWYPDAERPGGERYWDGAFWTDQRRTAGDSGFPAAPGAAPGVPFGAGNESVSAPPAYGAAPAFGQPSGAYGSPSGYTPYGAVGTTYPQNSMAGWGLGLSIAGLVLICCGGILLSIPGTIMGWLSMKAVDRGERDPNSRGTAKGAFVVGVIGVSLFVLLVVAYAGLLAFGGSTN